MKISLEWLSDFLALGGGQKLAEEAAEALMNGGLPVEVIEQHGNDRVLDVEVTSNRSDCLSHLGVARELGALLNKPVNEPKLDAILPDGASHAPVTQVSIESAQLCPHYIARVIRGVKIGPSPAWLARRLEAIGVRSINNVVDVTNYVMFELGQPLHAFDFDKLEGKRIVVRPAASGESIISIDGNSRELSAGMLVIADAARPVALAGVMGGRDSEVSGATVNILLESARFDPLSIRKASRALAMNSDSSYRFERGLDPALAERANLRATQLILATAGGELAGPAAAAGERGQRDRGLSLRLRKIRDVLGMEVAAEVAANALGRMRMSPKVRKDAGEDRIEVTIPGDRLDVNIEVDLVEEVARVIGYGRIPVREEISIRVMPPEPAARTIDALRSALVAGGYFEAVTFSFVSDTLAEDFLERGEGHALLKADAAVRKADSRLRPSLLPGLLEAVARNEHAGTPGARLFEIGSSFGLSPRGGGMAIDERRRLALVGGSDLREVRGMVEALLARLDPDRMLKVIPGPAAGFAAGACGRVEWAGETIGRIGKIDRAICAKTGLRENPAAAELELAPLLAAARHVPQLKPLPRFPAVRRDLSLVVGETVRYEQLEELIRANQPADLEDLEYVTTYRGKPLEKGQKSVTVMLVFRSASGTLTSEQVEEPVKKIVAAAQEKLKAVLRA